jgi:hypothetical protein
MKKFQERRRKVATALDLVGRLGGTTGSNKYMGFQPPIEQVWGSAGTPATGVLYVSIHMVNEFYRPNVGS